MKKIYITIALVLLASGLYAQDFTLGNVSKEELLQKKHPIDTSAAAAVLYKNGKTYFQMSGHTFYVVHEIECRIKIYKKEGYQYATDKIAYYTGGFTNAVLYTNAFTYNLVDDKIEKTELAADGNFEEKRNENISIKKITMPNVKVGSVIEYRRVIKTPYLSVFDDFHFQYSIPVNYVEYEIAIPPSYVYRRFIKGFVNLREAPEIKRISTCGRFEEIVNKFTAKSVKAFKGESYVNNIENYVGVMSQELVSSYRPLVGLQNYGLDWPSVANKIYKSELFGKELDLDSYYDNDIDRLLKGNISNERKIIAIFTYVKSRMKWNEQNLFFCEKGVKKAYTDKTGNAAEINLMLVSMLRYAKLNANPVLVSTRSNGLAPFPSLTAFDYVIAAVEINGGYVLLDATSKHTLPNVLPIRVLNETGRLIRKDGKSLEIDLMPQKPSKEVVNAYAIIDSGGNIAGKARNQYFDYNAYVFRENYNDTGQNDNVHRIENKYRGIQVGEYEVNNIQDLGKPVIETYSFTHDNLTDVIGDKIYLNPMLFFALTENPFILDKREFPVDFSYPYHNKYIISLKIPDGYIVESVPQSASFAMEENIGRFNYLIEAKNNMITIVTEHDINHASISAAYYQTLKDFYQKMVGKHNEKIVLKKI